MKRMIVVVTLLLGLVTLAAAQEKTAPPLHRLVVTSNTRIMFTVDNDGEIHLAKGVSWETALKQYVKANEYQSRRAYTERLRLLEEIARLEQIIRLEHEGLPIADPRILKASFKGSRPASGYQTVGYQGGEAVEMDFGPLITPPPVYVAVYKREIRSGTGYQSVLGVTLDEIAAQLQNAEVEETASKPDSAVLVGVWALNPSRKIEFQVAGATPAAPPKMIQKWQVKKP